jgi:hypothetical protein
MNKLSTVKIVEDGPFRVGRCDDSGFQQVVVVSGGGSGTVATVAFDQSVPGNTNKVTLGSDVVSVSQSTSLPAGTALLGKVGLDQTTPGTTNGVVINSGVVTTVSAVTAITNALPAGTNLLGKTGIDQTTPGTTNKVSLGSDVIHTILDSSPAVLNVAQVTTISSFNDQITVDLEPVVQLDFVYGINTQTGLGTVNTTGVVDTTNSMLRLQSGIGAAGSAIFNSKKVAKYRAGQGNLARFTCIFGTPASSSSQLIGVGNTIDGYFYGYNGTTFGILYRSHSVDTWIPASTWNGDKMDGTGTSGQTWDTTKGNVCQITYPFLGFGNVQFYVQSKSTSRFILVHTIQYTNTNTVTEIANPNLGFYAQMLNAGSTTNKIMYCGSVGIFITGKRSFNSSTFWGKDAAKTAVTTETNLLTIKNCTTYNTVANRGLVKLLSLNVAASGGNGTSIATFRLKQNATIGGSPSFSPIDGTSADNGVTITAGNSIVSFDSAGTTVTSGTFIYSMVTPGGSTGSIIDLSPFDIFIIPGDSLTVSGTSTSSTSLAASLNWTCEI